MYGQNLNGEEQAKVSGWKQQTVDPIQPFSNF